MSKKNKVAIVLRGGSVRGLGSLGFLKFLEKNDLKPDLVSGSSSGALLATAVALGYSYEDIIEKINSIRIRKYLNPTNIIRKGGIVSQNDFKRMIDDLTKEDLSNTKIESFEAPNLAILTCKRSDGSREIFTEGNLLDILSVSAAYPILMEQPKGKYQHLVDGDFTSGYSAKAIRELGYDKVIGVGYMPGRYIKSHEKNFILKTIDMYRTIGVEAHRLALQADPPDLEITYVGDDVGYLGIKKVDKLINRGYKSAKENEAEILKLFS